MDNRPVMASVVLLLLISFSVEIVDSQVVPPSLTASYYSTTCPSLHTIVDQLVRNAIKDSRNVVGGLLRLHFHDCFVRGCDASVLIDSIPPQLAEKDGPGNANSLRGFGVIDSIKTAIENACPGIVSCADILALVARSAVFQIGGPSWSLPLGRRDGNTSLAAETPTNLPGFNALYKELKALFAAKGLNEQDMVALSGAHTIGNTHCNMIEPRLYNSTGPGGLDPTLNATYAAQLIAQCPFSNGKSTTIIPMDPTLGNDTFDSNYYSNVLAGQGLFLSDATLSSTPVGSKFVLADSTGPPFFSAFAQAMTKMASMSVLLAPAGEVRQNCHVVNPPAPAAAPAAGPVASTPIPAPSPGAISTPTPAPSAAPPATPPPAPAPATPAATSPAQAPVPASNLPAPALAPVATSPALAPVPTSPAAPAVPVPALPVPAAAPTNSSTAPAPVATSSVPPAPARTSSSTSPAAPTVTSPAPVKSVSSSSSSLSPSPIFYMVVKAAEVLIKVLQQ